MGIVERCDGTTVYTIEGNSGDAVKERSYSISSDSIDVYKRQGWRSPYEKKRTAGKEETDETEKENGKEWCV